MSCFPCFGQKKKAARIDSFEENVVKQIPENPQQRASADKNDVDNGNITAKTFTFHELATATKIFRPECLLGEGGFGRVYKGCLGSNNEVEHMLNDRLLQFVNIDLHDVKEARKRFDKTSFHYDQEEASRENFCNAMGNFCNYVLIAQGGEDLKPFVDLICELKKENSSQHYVLQKDSSLSDLSFNRQIGYMYYVQLNKVSLH